MRPHGVPVRAENELDGIDERTVEVEVENNIPELKGDRGQ